jgi:hypothetical protein
MTFLGAGLLWSMNFSKKNFGVYFIEFFNVKIVQFSINFFIRGENIPKPSHCTHHGLPVIPRAKLEMWWFERSQCDKQGIKNMLALPIDKLLVHLYVLCPQL